MTGAGVELSGPGTLTDGADMGLFKGRNHVPRRETISMKGSFPKKWESLTGDRTDLGRAAVMVITAALIDERRIWLRSEDW